MSSTPPADPRLTENPYDAVAPDYTTDAHADVRKKLMAELNVTEEVVIKVMVASWAATNGQQKTLWDNQLAADAAKKKKADEDASAIEEAARSALEQEAKEALAEDRKKNPRRFVAIDPNLPVPLDNDFIPSNAILEKLRKQDHVLLWYFTNQTAADAEADMLNPSAFSLLPTDDGTVQLVPSATVRNSRRAVKDRNLSWDDFVIAIPRYIAAMEYVETPEDTIDMFHRMYATFIDRANRELHNVTLARRSVMHYACLLRKRWHLRVLREKKAMYSLVNINEELLLEARSVVREEMLLEKERERNDEVRLFATFEFCTNANYLFFSPTPLCCCLMLLLRSPVLALLLASAPLSALGSWAWCCRYGAPCCYVGCCCVLLPFALLSCAAHGPLLHPALR